MAVVIRIFLNHNMILTIIIIKRDLLKEKLIKKELINVDSDPKQIDYLAPNYNYFDYMIFLLWAT